MPLRFAPHPGKRAARHADRPAFDPTTLTDELGLRLPSGGAFLAGAAISPSRIACLRASLRDRLTASTFFLVILSEGSEREVPARHHCLGRIFVPDLLLGRGIRCGP